MSVAPHSSIFRESARVNQTDAFLMRFWTELEASDNISELVVTASVLACSKQEENMTGGITYLVQVVWKFSRGLRMMINKYFYR